MLAKKKKLSKKEMKEDKLVTSYFKVQQFFEEHQTKILAGIAAIVVIVVLTIVYSNKVEQDNTEATTQLSRIIDVYNSGSYQEAIDGRPGTNLVGLKKIVEEFGGTEQGENARIFLAHSNYFLGDFDVAEEYYSDYSGSNAILKASALAGEAACLESKGELKKAAGLYEEAAKISSENPSNSEYLLRAGINYKNSGSKEEAKDLFETIKKEYTGTIAFNEVDKYLLSVTE